jgi:hypothetical protein
LGGKLGDILFEGMHELQWFKLVEGKTTIYGITEKGCKELAKSGVDLSLLKRSKVK